MEFHEENKVPSTQKAQNYCWNQGEGKYIRNENCRRLAAAFALAVTAETQEGGGWIARNGPDSIFRVLQRVMPEIIQPEQKGHRFRLKEKISCAEFNKLLQARCGFLRARTRKLVLTRSAGNWLFSNRRWLNPADPVDLALLEANYDDLTSKFPRFGISCTRDNFIAVVNEVCRSWSDLRSRAQLNSSPTRKKRRLSEDATASDDSSSSTVASTAAPDGLANLRLAALAAEGFSSDPRFLLLPPLFQSNPKQLDGPLPPSWTLSSSVPPTGGTAVHGIFSNPTRLSFVINSIVQPKLTGDNSGVLNTTSLRVRMETPATTSSEKSECAKLSAFVPVHRGRTSTVALSVTPPPPSLSQPQCPPSPACGMLAELAAAAEAAAAAAASTATTATATFSACGERRPALSSASTVASATARPTFSGYAAQLAATVASSTCPKVSGLGPGEAVACLNPGSAFAIAVQREVRDVGGALQPASLPSDQGNALPSAHCVTSLLN